MRGALLVLAVSAGCSQARPVVDGRPSCLTWKESIGPELAQACGRCHGAGASYDVTSYLTTLTDSAGRAMATAGDENSPIIQTLKAPDLVHKPVAEVAADVDNWVTQCDLAYAGPGVHERGILNPANPDFHGKLVQSLGWNFSTCQGCHGNDFSGGTAGVSCLSCHQDPGGPTACTTCHGQPPDVGAHLAHASGALTRPLDCGECHVKPMVYTDVGHLFDAAGKVITTPTITFGALANLRPSPSPAALAAPAFDGARCSGVYCHGATMIDDSAATNHTPDWYGGASQATCGTCHGRPPSSHARSDCKTCHPKVVDQFGNVADPSRHVDGVVSLGDESGTCGACHGYPPTSGAHLAHLNGPDHLASPVACGECHAVPTTPTSPGHIDHAGVTVFPAGAGPISSTGGTRGSFDGTSCTVYCHGATLLGGSATTPAWSGGIDAIGCGTCHAIPPPDAAHAAVHALTDCARCHPQTMDPTGALLPANHMNGVVDVTP